MRSQTPSRSSGALARIAAVATAIVALAAAVLAYRATSATAVASGAVDHRFAWLAPIVVEGGLVASGSLAWTRISGGLRARAEIATSAALLALSVVIQIADARTHHATVLGQVIAAAPPVVLLICAESLLRELRRTSDVRGAAADAELRAAARAAARTSKPAGATKTATKPVPRPTAAQPVAVTTEAGSGLHSVPSAAPGQTVAPGPERDSIIRQMQAADPSVSRSEIGAALGISYSAVGRYLDKMPAA